MAQQHVVEMFLRNIVDQLYRHAWGLPGAQPGPFVGRADIVHAILHRPEAFQKNFALVAALGDSRFNTNGEEWSARREVTQRYYLSAGMSHNRTHVRAIYDNCFAALHDTSAAQVQTALLRASSRVFFTALGCQVDVDPLLDFFARARRHVKHLQYHSWNKPDASETASLDSDRVALLRDYRREIERAPPLRALMQDFTARSRLAAFDPAEELLMNFFAGIETTAATLGFAIDRLGINARVQQRLFDEASADEGTPYLDCYINETMRYFPPIPFVVRQATGDIDVDGQRFTNGQLVVLSIVGVHHDAAYWHEPQMFNTSRPAFLDNSYNRRAFIPFLSGPRMCGGATLGRLELGEGLGAFVRAFHVTRRGDEIAFDYGLALRADSWDQVEIVRR